MRDHNIVVSAQFAAGCGTPLDTAAYVAQFDKLFALAVLAVVTDTDKFANDAANRRALIAAFRALAK